MPPTNTPRKTLAAAAAALALLPLAGHADTYPSRPVTIVVAYPPGGSTDMLTRLIAANLEKKLGQPFIVLNKPGAAGNIGTAWAARAAPDGYTLAHSYVGTLAINPALYKKLPYDPKDLIGISPFASIPLFMVTPAGNGIHSLSELITKAKSHPGGLSYAMVGIGSPSHVFAEMFSARAGIKVLGVPFNGAGPAVTSLIGGQVDYMLTAGQVMQQVKAKKLTALATTDGKRSENFPDLPTVAETLPGFEAVSWHAFSPPRERPSRSSIC